MLRNLNAMVKIRNKRTCSDL